MGKDIIQLIIEDHNRGREMYRQYTSPHNSTKQKQLLAWHMIRESCVHSYKEEQVGDVQPSAEQCAAACAAAHEMKAHCQSNLQQQRARLAEQVGHSAGDEALSIASQHIHF